MNTEPGPQIDPTLQTEHKASAGTVMVATLAGIAIVSMVLYGVNNRESPSAVASNAPAATTGDPAAASQNLKNQNATDQSKPAQGQQQKANDQAAAKPAAAQPAPTAAGQAPANQAASNPPGSNSSGNSKQNNAQSSPQDNAQPAAKPNG